MCIRDSFDTVGIFTFEVDATGTITETGTSISSMLPYIQKWPHIKWLLTIMNHGIANIFTALRNNENGAKDKFLTEIIRIMNKYPWCAGVDIDLERGGGYENKDAANALFRDIYNTVKSYDATKLVNILSLIHIWYTQRHVKVIHFQRRLLPKTLKRAKTAKLVLR